MSRDLPGSVSDDPGTPRTDDSRAATERGLDDLWDRADGLADEGVGDLADDLRAVLARYDTTRCAAGHPHDSCGCKGNRILWNVRHQDIDELVIHEPELIHIEQMNDRCWWIGIYLDDDRRWSGNFTADSRGRMSFTPQDDDVEWSEDDSHEERRERMAALIGSREPSDG